MPSQQEPKQEFKIRGVSVQRARRRVLFHLSGSQNGCDKIAFDLNESPDLKQLLLSFFPAGRVFSFTAREEDPESGICKITSIDTSL